jgi:co-chaperonin GroES (HSP10)
MPHMPMLHEKDPKLTILESLGDISNVELFHNQVLLATYMRPTKTKSGLILTDSHVDEDRYQSKVGLLIKKGPKAFEQDGTWFEGMEFHEHDWLIFRPSDGWSITVNNVLCRIFDDINIKGRVQDPDAVY